MIELLVSALVGGIAGGIVGALSYARGERNRFIGEIGPLRSDIANLHDRFEHWTKRQFRREALEKNARRSPRSDDLEDVEGETSTNSREPLTRAEKLREVARRLNRGNI